MIFWHTVENLEALSLLKVGTRQMVGKRHTITVDRSSCQLFCTIFELRSIIFDHEKKRRKMRGQTWFAMTITKLHKIFVLHTFTFHRFAACKREREVQKGFKKQSIKVYSKLVFWWWKKFCVSAQKKKMRNCITVVALKSFRKTSWIWEAIVWSFFGVCIK